MRSRSSSRSPSCSRPGDLGARPPGAKGARHRAQGVRDVRGNPVAEHQRLGELVVALGVLGVRRQVGREQVERGDLGPRAPGQDVEQPEVVDVLVGDDEQLEVLDRVTVRVQLALELVQRLGRVRARVHERQRLVLDQVRVDPPDRERRGDRAGGGCRRRTRAPARPPRRRRSRADQREHLVAAALHVLVRHQRLEAQAQQRLGVRRPHVEVPVVVVDRDAVQARLPRVGVAARRSPPSWPAGRRPRS